MQVRGLRGSGTTCNADITYMYRFHIIYGILHTHFHVAPNVCVRSLSPSSFGIHGELKETHLNVFRQTFYTKPDQF